MKFFHRLEGIPSVPQTIIDEALSKQQYNVNEHEMTRGLRPAEYYQQTLRRGGRYWKPVFSKRFELDSAFAQWVQDNLVENYFETAVSIIFHDGTQDASLSPHADTNCRFRLIYPIKKGGKTCTTHWWQERNQPVLRDPGYWVSDYDRLEELEQVTMDEHNWYIIDTRAIHSVEQINDNKVALHVSMDDQREINRKFGVEFLTG